MEPNNFVNAQMESEENSASNNGRNVIRSVVNFLLSEVERRVSNARRFATPAAASAEFSTAYDDNVCEKVRPGLNNMQVH